MRKTPTTRTRDVTVAAGSITARDGKTHSQGTTVTLPDIEARDLIRAGQARPALAATARTSQAPETTSATETTTTAKGAR